MTSGLIINPIMCPCQIRRWAVVCQAESVEILESGPHRTHTRPEERRVSPGTRYVSHVLWHLRMHFIQCRWHTECESTLTFNKHPMLGCSFRITRVITLFNIYNINTTHCQHPTWTLCQSVFYRILLDTDITENILWHMIQMLAQ